MRQLHVALAYAKNGIPVFPCNLKTKRPIVGKGGFNHATTDETTIRRWWGRFPDALVGSPNTTHTAIDIDCGVGKVPVGTEPLVTGAMNDVIELCQDMNVVVSTTASNGYHIIFRHTPDVRRRIFFMPNIDIMGEGGYIILPDQRNYTSDRENPWDLIHTLDEFPIEGMKLLGEKNATQTLLAKELKNEKIGAGGEIIQRETAKAKPKKKKKSSTKKPINHADVPEIVEHMREKSDSSYKKGEIYLPQTPDMYKAKYVPPEDKVDPTQKLLVDGKLVIENNSLDTKRINELFYNQEIQIKLAEFLGIKVVSGETKHPSFRSLFMSHIDRKPSMAARWNSDTTHLIIRDFSNHFGDPLEQVDYNIVRLYATIRYGCQAPRLKPPEFVVWFLRMLVDSGILDVSQNIKKYAMPSISIGNGFRKIADGILLLDAIKQLYKGYDGITTFSDRFGAAWSNAVTGAVNHAKKALVESGLFAHVGDFDCSGGTRTDGFYKTGLYAVIDKEFTKQLRAEKRKEEEKMRSKIITICGIRTSEKSHQIIKNFCEDYDIPNVPERENMFMDVGLVDGEEKATREDSSATYYMEDLVLETIPSFDGHRNVLMLTGISESLEGLFWDNTNKYKSSDLNDEPYVSVVVSSDIGTMQLDLSFLTRRLSEYLDDVVSLDEQFMKTVPAKDVLSYLDGIPPTA